jgi:hypothetical protein
MERGSSHRGGEIRNAIITAQIDASLALFSRILPRFFPRREGQNFANQKDYPIFTAVRAPQPLAAISWKQAAGDPVFPVFIH